MVLLLLFALCLACTPLYGLPTQNDYRRWDSDLVAMLGVSQGIPSEDVMIPSRNEDVMIEPEYFPETDGTDGNDHGGDVTETGDLLNKVSRLQVLLKRYIPGFAGQINEAEEAMNNLRDEPMNLPDIPTKRNGGGGSGRQSPMIPMPTTTRRGSRILMRPRAMRNVLDAMPPELISHILAGHSSAMGSSSSSAGGPLSGFSLGSGSSSGSGSGGLPGLLQPSSSRLRGGGLSMDLDLDALSGMIAALRRQNYKQHVKQSHKKLLNIGRRRR